jgi:hypothetical protein
LQHSRFSFGACKTKGLIEFRERGSQCRPLQSASTTSAHLLFYTFIHPACVQSYRSSACSFSRSPSAPMSSAPTEVRLFSSLPANSLIENICRSSVRADQLRRRETIRRSWAAPALSRRQNSNQAAVFGALGPTASAQQAVSASCGPSGTPDPNNAQAVSDCNNAKQAQSAAFTGLQAAVNNYMPPGPTCPVSLDFL